MNIDAGRPPVTTDEEDQAADLLHRYRGLASYLRKPPEPTLDARAERGSGA
jgi:hypothetical protein